MEIKKVHQIKAGMTLYFVGNFNIHKAIKIHKVTDSMIYATLSYLPNNDTPQSMNLKPVDMQTFINHYSHMSPFTTDKAELTELLNQNRQKYVSSILALDQQALLRWALIQVKNLSVAEEYSDWDIHAAAIAVLNRDFPEKE